MVDGQKILENIRAKLEQQTTQHIANVLPPLPSPQPVPARPDTARRVERVRLDALDTTIHPEVATAVSAARRWSELKATTPEISLVLCGNYGTGKTHIAKAILWSICYTVDERPVAPIGKLFTANDLIQLLKAGNNPRDLLGQDCPILVIDDVGSEQAIEFVGAAMQDKELEGRYFRVVDYCNQHNISLIITSNLEPDNLAAVMGGRAWSRLMQMAPKGFLVTLFSATDYRIWSSGR